MKKNNIFAKIFFLFFVIALPLFILVCGKILQKMAEDLPSISQLENYTPNLSTKIYDKDNNLIAELFTERRMLVPINEIPMDLQNAFIAIEDRNFFYHWGVYTKGILRALAKAALKRKVREGGSTITQQLAKTIFLTSERTVKRKIKELLLMIEIGRASCRERV